MQIDWAVVFATIAGPIFAVWAAELRQKSRAVRDRKEWVFRTLMTTRGAKLRNEHVSAINHIEFAFPRKSCAAVEDARVLYRTHLQNPDSASEDQAIVRAWQNKANDLFADLLYQMALDLNIPFSKSDITKEAYYPDDHLFQEIIKRETQRLVLDVLKNGRPINIRSVNE